MSSFYPSEVLKKGKDSRYYRGSENSEYFWNILGAFDRFGTNRLSLRPPPKKTIYTLCTHLGHDDREGWMAENVFQLSALKASLNCSWVGVLLPPSSPKVSLSPVWWAMTGAHLSLLVNKMLFVAFCCFYRVSSIEDLGCRGLMAVCPTCPGTRKDPSAVCAHLPSSLHT